MPASPSLRLKCCCYCCCCRWYGWQDLFQSDIIWSDLMLTQSLHAAAQPVWLLRAGSAAEAYSVPWLLLVTGWLLASGCGSLQCQVIRQMALLCLACWERCAEGRLQWLQNAIQGEGVLLRSRSAAGGGGQARELEAAPEGSSADTCSSDSVNISWWCGLQCTRAC